MSEARDLMTQIGALQSELDRLRKENAALRGALELALRSHGVLLPSDPPQDAWKYNRVEDVARAALQGAKND